MAADAAARFITKWNLLISLRSSEDLRRLGMQFASQGDRLDDLHLPADLEQHAQRDVLAVELQRHGLAALVAIAERLQTRPQPRAERIHQVLAPLGADVHLDREVARRRVALEALAPAFPELLQVELRIARE